MRILFSGYIPEDIPAQLEEHPEHEPELDVDALEPVHVPEQLVAQFPVQDSWQVPVHPVEQPLLQSPTQLLEHLFEHVSPQLLEHTSLQEFWH